MKKSTEFLLLMISFGMLAQHTLRAVKVIYLEIIKSLVSGERRKMLAY